MEINQLSGKNQFTFGQLTILSVLMAFASISTDLYLPALPMMAQSFRVSAGMMELTVSGYLIGFSLGQLFWGPFSDRYGRRLPIAIGLVLFLIGSLGSALAASAGSIIFWRVVQALGACASVVLARAMVRDVYEGPNAARMMSTVITAMAVAPMLGPSLGALILRLGSWRWIFWLLVCVGILTLISLMLLPETLPKERRNILAIKRALQGYISIIRHRHLLGYAGAGAFFYGVVFASISGTPFAYISYYGVTPQIYGLLFALGIIGLMFVNQINRILVAKVHHDHILQVGVIVAAVATMMLAFDARTDWGGLLGLVIPILFFISANGFIVANSMVGALSLFPESAGAASALIGALQYGFGVLGSTLVAVFADGTPWPMGAVMAIFGLGSLLCFYFILPTYAPRSP